MKGRKLSLQEVLNLEDGSKVWVEDTDERDEQIGVVDRDDEVRVYIDEGDGWFEVEGLFDCEEYVLFYEWIEDLDIIEIKSNVPTRCSTCYSLAQEICNLRGLDLTDENIRLIVEEFS